MNKQPKRLLIDDTVRQPRDRLQTSCQVKNNARRARFYARWLKQEQPVLGLLKT